MKKNAVRIAAVLFAVFFLLGSGSPRTADDVIEELILYHGCYGDEADAKVEALLGELRALDSRQGELWSDIMAYWNYVNQEMPVNANRLPKDLPKDDSLCIIVLGYALNKDGSMKKELLRRLDVALSCAKQYPNAYVLCTGGGTAKEAPDVTEGRAMGDWMLAHGVSQKRLIVEDRSKSTASNAINSYRILYSDYPSVDSVAIVSSSYHVPWGSLLFEASFERSSFARHTPRIRVISNASCSVDRKEFDEADLLRMQTGGMLQLIGRNDLAREFYYNYDEFEKPPL